MIMDYSYYPGCSLQGMASEYDLSARKVCERLSVTLTEAPDWVCCGATPAHATDHLLSIALPAVTLSNVWETRRPAGAEGGDPLPTVVAACAACYSRLRVANHEMRTDPALRAKVQEKAGIAYEGQVEVRHLLDILRNDLGPDAIRAKVTRPLAGLKVACYYGCLLVRPPKVVAFDDPENPRVMDDLLEAAGATCVEWPHKTECCGGNFSLGRPDLVAKLVGDVLREAKDAGAHVVDVACPLCQTNLDLRQSDAQRRTGEQFGLPVLYFTQLLGLALGLSEKELGIGRLVVPAGPALQAVAGG